MGGVGSEGVDGGVAGVELEVAKGMVTYAPVINPRTAAICDE